MISELDFVKQLLHDGLELARERITMEGGFSPFAVLLVDNNYHIVETHDRNSTGFDGIIYLIKEKQKEINIEAFICCVDGIVISSGKSVQINAIELILENRTQSISGYQLYGKNFDGKLVFAPLEAEEVEFMVFIDN
jgi:hypothetical protein